MPVNSNIMQVSRRSVCLLLSWVSDSIKYKVRGCNIADHPDPSTRHECHDSRSRLLLCGLRVIEDQVELARLHVEQLQHHWLRQVASAVLRDALSHPLVVVIVLGPLPEELWRRLLCVMRQQRF